MDKVLPSVWHEKRTNQKINYNAEQEHFQLIFSLGLAIKADGEESFIISDRSWSGLDGTSIHLEEPSVKSQWTTFSHW